MFGLPLHHIGIACKDIESTAAFVNRNYSVKSDTGTVFDEIQNAFVRLFDVGETCAIELISGNAVAKVLDHRATYYHVCYVTDDITATLAEAKKGGAILVSGPNPAVLFGMRKIAFIYTLLGLVEFLEK